MSAPIIAYHIVFGAYGFWLPNDSRGSWSDKVWAPRLTRFGPPRMIHPDHHFDKHELRQRHEMQQELNYPAVRFDDSQIAAIATGFGERIAALKLVVYEAALLADHVHLVVARQEMHAEQIAGFLKRGASRELRQQKLHPLLRFAKRDGSLPTPWEEGGWQDFLHTTDELENAILYARGNLVRIHKPPQKWPWLSVFEG